MGVVKYMGLLMYALKVLGLFNVIGFIMKGVKVGGAERIRVNVLGALPRYL
jgi:hypothetical protein